MLRPPSQVRATSTHHHIFFRLIFTYSLHSPCRKRTRGDIVWRVHNIFYAFIFRANRVEDSSLHCIQRALSMPPHPSLLRVYYMHHLSHAILMLCPTVVYVLEFSWWRPTTYVCRWWPPRPTATTWIYLYRVWYWATISWSLCQLPPSSSGECVPSARGRPLPTFILLIKLIKRRTGSINYILINRKVSRRPARVVDANDAACVVAYCNMLWMCSETLEEGEREIA